MQNRVHGFDSRRRLHYFEQESAPDSGRGSSRSCPLPRGHTLRLIRRAASSEPSPTAPNAAARSSQGPSGAGHSGSERLPHRFVPNRLRSLHRGTHRSIRRTVRTAPDGTRLAFAYRRRVATERIPRETQPPRCARYVRRYGEDGGPCNREAIAIVDGGPVCYVHAPVEARDKPTARWRPRSRWIR